MPFATLPLLLSTSSSFLYCTNQDEDRLTNLTLVAQLFSDLPWGRCSRFLLNLKLSGRGGNILEQHIQHRRNLQKGNKQLAIYSWLRRLSFSSQNSEHFTSETRKCSYLKNPTASYSDLNDCGIKAANAFRLCPLKWAQVLNTFSRPHCGYTFELSRMLCFPVCFFRSASAMCQWWNTSANQSCPEKQHNAVIH